MNLLSCAFRSKKKHPKFQLVDLFRERKRPSSSPQNPQREIQAIDRFAEPLSKPIVSYQAIQSLAWNGIPSCLRPKLWKYLLKYMLINDAEQILSKKRQEYRQLLGNYWRPQAFSEEERKVYHTIDVDVKRIGTEYSGVCGGGAVQMLKRVLFIWHNRHPASGYVQGMCDLSMPFLIVFLSEDSGVQRGGGLAGSGDPGGSGGRHVLVHLEAAGGGDFELHGGVRRAAGGLLEGGGTAVPDRPRTVRALQEGEDRPVRSVLPQHLHHAAADLQPQRGRAPLRHLHRLRRLLPALHGLPLHRHPREVRQEAPPDAIRGTHGLPAEPPHQGLERAGPRDDHRRGLLLPAHLRPEAVTRPTVPDKYIMSDIKLRKSTANFPRHADSHTHSRNKQERRRPPHQETTVTKNLLADFNALNRPPSRGSQLQESQLESQSESVCATSHLSDLSQQSSILEQRERSNEYGTQLPQSYILAMSGLQEAVKIRDADIRKLKKQVKEQAKLHEHCDEDKEVAKRREQQLQEGIKELQLEIKFLKNSMQEMKAQHSETIKEKTLLENQLKNMKENNRSQSFNSQNELEHCRRDLQTAMKELDRLSQENREKKSELDSRKKEMTDLLLREGEARANDKAEIEGLKHQLALFSERLAIEEARAKEQSLINERQKLESMEVELAVNRQILKEVTLEANQPRPRSYTLPEPPPEPQTEQKSVPKLPLQPRSDQSASKYDNPTAAKMQRSSSRMRISRQSQNRTDRRNLISQYREQIRYEKQLQALNYQMELLEKNMVTQSDPARKDELQRSYGKLKREIEKKQLEIRDIKTFLNDPIK